MDFLISVLFNQGANVFHVFLIPQCFWVAVNNHADQPAMLLSALVYSASALHISDFGSARYGLVYATGRQNKYSPIKKHSRGSVPSIVIRACFSCTQRNIILDDSTGQSLRRALTFLLPSPQVYHIWRWRQYIPPKRWYLRGSPNGEVLTAVRTSNLKLLLYQAW
jgi:hypothetical protein